MIVPFDLTSPSPQMMYSSVWFALGGAAQAPPLFQPRDDVLGADVIIVAVGFRLDERLEHVSVWFACHDVMSV